ncbi:MAG: DUF2339 domain-containing protein [Deltaproteobacteria bacterium]|nr:DUF2339 domain-containing protein [Deltaproteobacteria bacterium]
MDVIAALFGILIVLGVPLVGLISGLVSWSRISGLTRRIDELEAEQLRLNAELQRTQHSLAGVKAARPAAAPARTQGAPSLSEAAGALQQGPPPLSEAAGALQQGPPPLSEAAGALQQGAPPFSEAAGALQQGPPSFSEATGALQQGPPPLSEAAGALQQGSPPLSEAAGALPQGSAPLPEAPAPGRAGRPPRIGPARPPVPGMGRPADGPPAPRRAPITVEWLITRLAAALGGFSLLLGAIFALSAAIDKGWVGPGLRVFVGLLLGTGAVVRGATLRAKGMSWSGAGLLGAGQGVLYGSIFAAASLYHLLGQATAFGALCALTALGMALATRLRDPVSATLSLIGGLMTPVLLSTGENNALGLFSYLTVLTGGAVYVAARRGWAPLLLAAALGALALFLGWTERYRAPDQLPAAVLALGVLALPLIAAALSAARRPPTDGGALGLRGAALGALGLLALCGLLWVVPVDPEFIDPRSGQASFRPLGAAPLWSLAAALLLPLPALVVARQAPLTDLARGAPLLAGLLGLAFVTGHIDAPGVGLPLIAAGLAGPTLYGLGLRGSAAAPAAGLSPLVTALIAAAALGAADAPPPGLALLALAAPPVVAVLSGRVAPLGAPAAAAGLALVGLIVTARLGELSAPEVLGGGALAAGLLGAAPLRWPRQAGAADGAHWLGAALATPVVFLPLWRAWQEQLGDDAQGLLPLGLAVIPLLGTLTLLRVHGAHRGSGLLALFFGMTLAGVTTAIPLQLEDQWLTVAWALEGAALAWLTRRLTHPLVPWSSFALGLVVAARLVLNPYALEYGDTSGLPLLNWTLYTWGLPLVCLLLTARLLGPQLRGDVQAGAAALPGWARGALVLAAVAVGFALVNVQVSDFFQDAGPIELGGHGVLQGMVRSLAWALYGVIVLSIGMGKDSKELRLVGFGLVMLAALKVFGSDLWSLQGFMRVGSIMGLGVTLMVAAFLFERLVLRKQREKDAQDAQDEAEAAAARGAPPDGEPPAAPPGGGAA